MTKRAIPAKILLPLCLSLLAQAAFGLDTGLAAIADDSQLRLAARGAWLAESPARVLAMRPALNSLPGGDKVEIRSAAGRGEITVTFARQSSQNGQFPGWAQGSWEFTRNAVSGETTLVRVFPRSDQYTYIQFRPFNEDRVQMDVLLYDAYAVSGLVLPVSMDRLSVMPLADILRLAGSRFPARYFEPKPDDYRDTRQLVSDVRKNLPGLNFADDGAIDQNGHFVYINGGEIQEGEPGLNCSGFAKWLIDGILRPVTGERLEIPPLKAPFGDRGSSFTEPFEALRDPFFGLDWIRNLAARTWTVLRSQNFATLEEIEVRSAPFSQINIRRGSSVTMRPFPGFLENAGFGIEGLLPLLYTLAVDEPNRFFLGAVNTDTHAPTTPENLRGRPRMRQFFHVAALVPYFDANGIFRVAVFESAAETSINAVRSRYPSGHNISLVRLPVERAFDP